MKPKIRIYSVGLVGTGNVMRAFIIHYLKISGKIQKDYGFKLKFTVACDSKSFIASNKLDVRSLMSKKEKGHLLGNKITDPLDRFSRHIRTGQVDILIDGLPSSKKDEGPSFGLLCTALTMGKTLICVNKAPLVFKGEELYRIAREHNAKIGMSATSAGALPSSGLILNELVGSCIYNLRGILNGTSNYVLDKIMFENYSLVDAIKEAIILGIAEPDYRFDLEGIDTSYKMIILGLILTGKSVHPHDVPCTGILELDEKKLVFLANKGKVVRLVGNLNFQNSKPKISVAPEVLIKTDPLFAVYGSNKGISFRTRYMGDLSVIGGASGRTTIAATILKDIINLNKDR